jgi:hypothetical protein
MVEKQAAKIYICEIYYTKNQVFPTKNILIFNGKAKFKIKCLLFSLFSIIIENIVSL